MAHKDDIALMAHLMRRAGFGATREELEKRVANGYEKTVEELLHPEEQVPVNKYDLCRYHPNLFKPATLTEAGGSNFMFYMIHTNAPLQEKMNLFWHSLFATGVSKVDNYDEIMDMIDKFRENGMGNYKQVLVDVAKSPAMIYWLDNNENHAYAVNENWGRELLELFSMGVGNYTETDVREASRAFTGWTRAPKISRFPYNRFDAAFEYKPEDHDEGEKTFLGYTGNFNGDDIIHIICEQPATARFICRYLYSYFVADETQVAAWSVTPPRDPEAIEYLAKVFRGSKGEIVPVLRALFNSDFFKAALFSRIKSPAEMVVGVMRFVGGAEFPFAGFTELARQPMYMGHDLLNPPSVEGWHTGQEWINSGTLMKRINFCSDKMGEVHRPGIRAVIDRIKAQGDIAPEQLVDMCMDELGPLVVADGARQELVNHTAKDGDLCWGTEQESSSSEQRVASMLQMVVALREYQYA